MQLTPELQKKMSEMYPIPKEQNIKLSTLEDLGFIKSQTAKLEIHRGNLKAIKIGNRFFVPRLELMRYFAQQMGLLEDKPDMQSGTLK